MKLACKTLALGLAALGLHSSSAMAAPAAEFGLLFPLHTQSPVTNNTKAQPRISSGLKVNTAHEDPTGAVQPAQITFVNMLDVPAGATDVDVLISYTDRSGAIHVVRPSFIDGGCTATAGSEGADVTCLIVSETE